MNTSSAQPVAPSDDRVNHLRGTKAFHGMQILVGAYLGISLLTLVAIVALRDNPAIVNDAAWIRGTIVAITSILMFVFAIRAAHGSRAAFLRVRIMSAVMVVAIAVIITLPGLFPLWMRIEQAVCGLILVGVVVIVNGRKLRALFAGN